MAYNVHQMHLGRRHLSSVHDWHIHVARIIHPLVSPCSSTHRYDCLDLVCGKIIPTLEQIRQSKLRVRGGAWSRYSRGNEAPRRAICDLVAKVGLGCFHRMCVDQISQQQFEQKEVCTK